MESRLSTLFELLMNYVNLFLRCKFKWTNCSLQSLDSLNDEFLAVFVSWIVVKVLHQGLKLFFVVQVQETFVLEEVQGVDRLVLVFNACLDQH